MITDDLVIRILHQQPLLTKVIRNRLYYDYQLDIEGSKLRRYLRQMQKRNIVTQTLYKNELTWRLNESYNNRKS